MIPFTYSRAGDVDDAVAVVNRETGAKFLGGGTNLIDLMKMGTEQPTHLVDITRLPLTEIEDDAGGLRIGAMARNSTVAAHPLVLERYPLLSQALLSGASPQLRNMATTGGNLLQRTRCYYFYDPSFGECNKRVPGSGCSAIDGYNRIHAVLGTSQNCIAAYPGDMPVALTALDARILVKGPDRERTVEIKDFYRVPGNQPWIENDLQPGELITAVELPPPPPNGRSHYVKVRDRNSYAFALASAAALVDLDDNNRIREARVALGGVATKPWRVPAAEETLRGREPAEELFRKAADLLVSGATQYRYNGFKVELAKRTAVRALTVASQRN